MPDPVATPAAAPATPASASAPTVEAAAAPAETAAPAAPAAESGSLVSEAKAEPVTPAADPPKPADGKPPIFPDFPTLKLPEGVKADDSMLTGFLKDAKDSGLSGDQAQKLIDKYAGKLVPAESLQASVDASTKLWKDMQAQWQAEVKSDPLVGGANLSANLARIAKVIDSVGGDKAGEIRQALNMTGAGNNPAIIRFLNSIASQLSVEGRTVPAGGPSARTFKNASEVLYGKET